LTDLLRYLFSTPLTIGVLRTIGFRQRSRLLADHIRLSPYSGTIAKVARRTTICGSLINGKGRVIHPRPPRPPIAGDTNFFERMYSAGNIEIVSCRDRSAKMVLVLGTKEPEMG